MGLRQDLTNENQEEQKSKKQKGESKKETQTSQRIHRPKIGNVCELGNPLRIAQGDPVREADFVRCSEATLGREPKRPRFWGHPLWENACH
jgi:hypothetical protein